MGFYRNEKSETKTSNKNLGKQAFKWMIYLWEL